METPPRPTAAPDQDGRTPVLTVVIPVYNERDTWGALVDRVVAAPLPGLGRQIVLVDDGSTDGTREQLAAFAPPERPGVSFTVRFHPANRGKGAALRTGFALATGEFVIVQDADLEYDPADYPRLLAAALAGEADAVFGNRFPHARPAGEPLFFLANRFLTCLFNLATGARLGDMETCYKLIRRPLLAQLTLRQDRFGFEPEVAAALVARGARIREVPIRYRPRTRREGKKITWKDGLRTLVCILKAAMDRLLAS